ncbi:shikimate dehydrogenase [Pseudaminobacter sp. 19-2017]|uniref:Shikimate dehydrogenase (NADP(+)) n=1 Tax=Pseudaminobacter soli (ex Zhang et al. 2022) TaxID=2831468 RepID=A0A942E2D7_9HYPH|nr:shikimate dehydrogenase [Pseudaminobacter soli]MBS3649765.1 shikimate dehydrogenase [Pseudaminobacter soli]
MAEQPRRSFVCGHPIKHSRSPKIHGYWLERYGIGGSYVAVDVAPEEFSTFAAAIKAGDYVGGNVTIPHKEAAFQAVDRRDEAASAIGAVNTLWVEDGLLHGSNTDAYGFAANLDERAPGWANGGGTAAVLGAGGAARAVLFALKQRGFSEVRLFNRTVERAEALAREFGPIVSAHPLDHANDRVSDASLLVNTTSAGMHGQPELDLDLTRLPADALVTDIVYVPLETPLLAAARRAGLKTVDGLGMLLHQAVPGFERWFGRRPEVTAELRDLIVADLEPVTA